jgi:hypothetical protein
LGAPTRNDGYDYDKMENDNGISETATPHPALSRKGRGNCHDHDKMENDNGIK